MAGNVSSAKVALRREVEARRRALEPDEVKRLGGEVQQRLAALLSFRRGLTVAMYAASPTEVPTQRLFEEARAQGCRCVFPRVAEGQRVLSFHALASFTALVPARRLPILEPPEDAPQVALTSIDVFLVPGVAFSPSGARLGRGGGHYDATLAGAPGRRIALTWEYTIVDEVPLEPTDELMDALVTEARATVCRPWPARGDR